MQLAGELWPSRLRGLCKVPCTSESTAGGSSQAGEREKQGHWSRVPSLLGLRPPRIWALQEGAGKFLLLNHTLYRVIVFSEAPSLTNTHHSFTLSSNTINDLRSALCQPLGQEEQEILSLPSARLRRSSTDTGEKNKIVCNYQVRAYAGSQFPHVK